MRAAVVMLVVGVGSCSRAPSGSVVIEAAKGGTVSSADGAFVLEVPPNALKADTPVTVRLLDEASWPAEVRSAAPVGPVWELEPDGVVFDPPARATTKLPVAPPGMIKPGEVAFLQHLMRSKGGAVERATTRTIVEADGSVTVVAELPHASQQWISFGGFSVGHGALGGLHEVEETWNVAPLTLLSASATQIDGYALRSIVDSTVSDPPIVPLHPGWDPSFGWAGRFTLAAAQNRPGVVALSPDAGFPIPDPLPGWLCVEPGSANTTASIVLDSFRDAGSLELLLPITPAFCVEKGGTVPPRGTPYTRECAKLPFEFTPITGRQGQLGVLCLPPDGGCFFTNDIMVDQPPTISQCVTEHRAMVVTHSGTLGTANAHADWGYAYASSGLDLVRRSTNPRDAVAETVVLHSLTDGGRWRADFAMDAGAIRVAGVTRFTGVLPQYGAVWDAADAPRTFNTSIMVGQAQVFARICWETTGLYLHGDVDATPEDDRCRAGHYAAALMVNSSGALLDATHPSTTDTYTVVSTTAGTMATDSVTQIPAGVDVTTVISGGSRGQARIVYRYTGGGFIVQSVTLQ